MENIKKGTDGFNQNMEALKHNFLLRGYFKSLEKQKQKKADTIRKR
jgi:phospholipid/cholesterol/gamma-HCH transport system substrate-binding protein